MDILEARNQVRALTSELRVFNKVAATGKLGIQDVIVVLKALGLPPEMSAALTQIQIAIATINAFRVTLAVLKIELGPLGWILLIGGAIAGMAATQEMQARRPRY